MSPSALYARDLAPCVKKTARSYRFYHYTTLDKIEATRPKDMSIEEAIRDHAQLWSEYYWKPGRRRGITGLYSAPDPASSRGYGDTDFYLYRIEAPPQTAYIELSPDACPFSPETKEALQAAGCQADPRELVYFANSNPSCLKLLREAYRALKVRAFLGPWNVSTFRDCDRRRQEGGGSWIWNDLSGLPASSVRLFRPTLPPAGTPERAEALGESILGCEKLAKPRPSTPIDPGCAPVDSGLGPLGDAVESLDEALRSP